VTIGSAAVPARLGTLIPVGRASRAGARDVPPGRLRTLLATGCRGCPPIGSVAAADPMAPRFQDAAPEDEVAPGLVEGFNNELRVLR
jgi:hypothetical protein